MLLMRALWGWMSAFDDGWTETIGPLQLIVSQRPTAGQLELERIAGYRDETS